MLPFSWRDSHRRVGFQEAESRDFALHNPLSYGQVGDRLWVRESFILGTDPVSKVTVPVWKCGYEGDVTPRWRPSIHMPRKYSRITLEITGVSVERLQEISEKDAKAEGAGCSLAGILPATHRECFKNLWDSINGKAHPWESNPWVWKIEFRRRTKC